MSQSGGGEGPYEQLCVAAPVTSHAQPAASDSSAQPHVAGHLPNPHGRVCTRMRASMRARDCVRAYVRACVCEYVCERASKRGCVRAVSYARANVERSVRLTLQISVRRCTGEKGRGGRAHSAVAAAHGLVDKLDRRDHAAHRRVRFDLRAKYSPSAHTRAALRSARTRAIAPTTCTAEEGIARSPASRTSSSSRPSLVRTTCRRTRTAPQQLSGAAAAEPTTRGPVGAGGAMSAVASSAAA